MNDNRMKNIQNLIDSLEIAVYADELLKEIHTISARKPNT